MGVVVRKQRVSTAERSYLPGEVVPGLSAKEEAELVKLGVCDWIGAAEVISSGFVGPENATSNDADPAPALSELEQFTALKAEPQKGVLVSLDIIPGTNAVARIKQYSEYLADNAPPLKLDEDSEEDDEESSEGGPNTSVL